MLTAEQKEKVSDDLKKFFGLPPYNTVINTCFGDGYFRKSIEMKYGMKIHKLSKITGVEMK